MIDSFKKLLNLLTDGEEDHQLDQSELRLATAALLVHAAAVDGHIAARERELLKGLLARHFDLAPQEAEDLLAEAEARERDAVDIYTFTRVLQQHLDQDERQTIVELMWEVVAADGETHPYESNLVWRAAELIGVSTRDRVVMRQKVFERHGIGGET